MNSKYEVLTGILPKRHNELVIIVNKNQVIPDAILYTLDLKNRKEITTILEKLKNQEEVQIDSATYSYDDSLNVSYKLILNTDSYQKENGG